jgi:hypothetical protein
VRLKVVILVVLAAGAGAGLMAILMEHGGAGPLPSPASAPGNPSVYPPDPAASANSAPESVPPAAPPADEEQRLRQIRAKKSEINQLADRGDAAALDAILDQLNQPEREVRQAALAATMRLDNRAAIPRLKQVADATEDAEEKKSLLDAADYLALPSPAEIPPGERATAGTGAPGNKMPAKVRLRP